MYENDSSPCHLLINYIAEDCSESEKRRFEQHLMTCPSCREEVAALKQVWHELGTYTEELPVPSEWKKEIIDAVVDANNATEIPVRSSVTAESKQASSKMWMYAAAAVLVVVIAGIWAGNYGPAMTNRPSSPNVALNVPSQVKESYRLRSFDEKMPSAGGKCQILQHDKKEQLMLNVSGLAATQGKQAYQVWLIRNGKRVNAGTFRVGADGEAGLIYPLNTGDELFEQIGITLEPDPNGSEPRGKKVLGT